MDLLSELFGGLLNLPREVLGAALAVVSVLLFAVWAGSWIRAGQHRRAARARGNVLAFDKRRPRSRRPQVSRFGLAQLAPLAIVFLTAGLAIWFDLDVDLPTGSKLSLRGSVTHVRDGDTIEVANVPVRIANLDCAEMGTAEGRTARERMVQIVRGQQVACDLEGRMSHDREVGTCALASSGEDLGEILIRERMCGRW